MGLHKFQTFSKSEFCFLLFISLLANLAKVITKTW